MSANAWLLQELLQELQNREEGAKNTHQAQKLMLLALKATAICFPYCPAASGAPCSEDGDLAGFCNPVELLLSLPASPAASLHTLRPIILRLFIAAAVPTQPFTYEHFNHQHLSKPAKFNHCLSMAFLSLELIQFCSHVASKS